MKKRFALPGLVILFSAVALALMSVTVRTTRAQDSLQQGATEQAAAVDQPVTTVQEVQSAASQAASGRSDRPTPMRTTPAVSAGNHDTVTPATTSDDSSDEKSGCCG